MKRSIYSTNMNGNKIDFSIGLENVKSIPFQNYENNFTFFVNGKQYKTNRFIADLLSPKIRNYHFSDQSIDKFDIDISNFNRNKKNSNEKDYFDEFLGLSSFSNVKLDPNRLKYFLNYFYILGNSDEYYRLKSYFLKDITKENAIEQLISFANLDSNDNESIDPNDQSIQEIIQFIAKNFWSISKEKLKLLNINILEIILSQESLKVQSENSLLHFILELYKKDPSYSPLFEYIIFPNVTEDYFEQFINEFEFEDLNPKIWHSICYRLIPSKFKKIILNEDDKINRYINLVKQFNYEKGKEFDGIFKYLTKKTGSNIHDNGTIKIDSNSIFNDDPECCPKHLVDYNSESFYQSKDQNGSFIVFDFKEKSIQLDGYTIQNGVSNGHYYLKNWVIEASNDNDYWITIDEHENDGSLDRASAVVTFDVQKKKSGFYRYIKLRQTGQSWSQRGKHFSFWFLSIEFFGKLKFPVVEKK